MRNFMDVDSATLSSFRLSFYLCSDIFGPCASQFEIDVTQSKYTKNVERLFRLCACRKETNKFFCVFIYELITRIDKKEKQVDKMNGLQKIFSNEYLMGFQPNPKHLSSLKVEVDT